MRRHYRRGVRAVEEDRSVVALSRQRSRLELHLPCLSIKFVCREAIPLAVHGCSGPDWPYQDQTKFQRARSLDSEVLIEHVKSSNSVSMFGGTRAGDVVRGRE